MTGAECLLRTLVAGDVEVCFMNPGTSEMHFVAALDRVPEMLEFYGTDVMLLIGGGLLAARERLTEETAAFVHKVTDTKLH